MRKSCARSWTAAEVGMAVFAAMMVGVGGYQVSAVHVVGAFMLGIHEDPRLYWSTVLPAGSALSTCPGTSEDGPGVGSSSPPGLMSACN